MSETARVLRFPYRWQAPLSQEDVEVNARRFVEMDPEQRSEKEMDLLFSDPDVLSSICKLLGRAVNADPKLVLERSAAAYRRLSAQGGSCGLFDESDYFLGEFAILAGGAFRLLGDRDEAETWVHRAEAGFRHTVNPGPQLARVAYLRLTLEYDRGRYQNVLELLPSTLRSFEKFGMKTEAAKAYFLEAMTLKQSSRAQEAFEKLTSLREKLEERREDAGLLSQVLVGIGAHHGLENRFQEALETYQQALVCLAQTDRRYSVADLKMAIGETLRDQGALSPAADAFREAVEIFAEVGMTGNVAYGRIILAETLIALNRHREAEWEIQAALPVIEAQKMVREGLAAVALLRESVSRRQADPNALRELREHLKANG